MKNILLSIFLLASINTFAQSDSSQLTVTITLKQKNIAFMGYQMSISNTLMDTRLRDTLIKYLGSGNNPDSQIVTHFKAGIVVKFISNLFNITAGVTYGTIYEVGNGSTGYTGIVSQLFTKAFTVNSEQGIGKWLYVQIANLLTTGTNVMNGFISSGTTWLQTPINFN